LPPRKPRLLLRDHDHPLDDTDGRQQPQNAKQNVRPQTGYGPPALPHARRARRKPPVDFEGDYRDADILWQTAATGDTWIWDHS
jgi:hypothetical protein